MIHSIIQIIVFQILFLAVYDLFLKRESFFNWNRTYLLSTPILGVVLPFISLGFIQQNIPQEYFVQLPAIMLEGEAGSSFMSWMLSFKTIWILGMIFSGLVFSFKIYKIIKLKQTGVAKNIEGVGVIILPGTDVAFSFLNKIYLGEKLSEENTKSILAHEKAHIQQKHSLDLLYFELLRIVFWFNPLVYLFQNRISLLHEYIADAEVTLYKDKRQYYQNLLSEVFQTDKISFINSFYNKSLIKNRILMLQKSKSPKIKLMKYLLLLPVLGIMLTYTSCSDAIENPQVVEDAVVDSNILPPPPPPIPTLPPPPPPPPAPGEKLDVPYSVIEKVPTYPGCSGDNEAMKSCMSTKIAEFVNENFNTELSEELNLSGRQRIAIQFKIDQSGDVVDVRARGPHPKLEAEAIRVVRMLPQMSPGEQKGEKVVVLYSLPIVFDVK